LSLLDRLHVKLQIKKKVLTLCAGADHRGFLLSLCPFSITVFSRSDFTHLIYMLQILCFWTLSIVLSLSQNTALFTLQNTTFRRMEIGTSSIYWAQLSRFCPKTEGETSHRNVAFCCINRTISNVQKRNISTDVPSSQMFGSYLLYIRV
jgi:hypothetical protein